MVTNNPGDTMNTLLTEHMTLDQKLAAIDEAMKTAEIKQQENPEIAVDPIEALMCFGCQ